MPSAQAPDWARAHDVTRVFNRYFQALDDRELGVAHLRTVFAEGAEVGRPNGTTMVGPEAIADSHGRSFARFAATQHLLTGHDVTFDAAPTMAHLRANLVAMHLWAPSDDGAIPPGSSFLAGGVITARLTSTAAGWRIARLDHRNVWRRGTGFASMAATQA